MRYAKLFGLLTSLSLISTTHAAAWFELEGTGTSFTQRVMVTIENPADVPTEAALVHLPLNELRSTLPDAKDGQVAVVDPTTKKAHREQADKNFVPFQVSNDTLIFAVPLKAHESKQLFIYTSPQHAILPGFPAKTGYDSRHAYRSFENNLMAFRMETGPGANTTGMAVDLFGKSKKGQGLRLVEIYEQGDYHHPQTWGVDILKVGSGPGSAGAYVIAGDEMGRPAADQTNVNCVYSGPVETLIRATAPVKIGDRTVTLVRNLTLVADDRSIHDTIEIQGDNLQGLQLGLGIRDLPNPTWREVPDKGYTMITGDNNQPGCKVVGMSAVFSPSLYVKTIDLPDKKNGGHVYVLNTQKTEHRIASIWDGDGQINNAADLEKTLQRWSDLRDHPIKIEVAKEAEKKG